MDSELGHVARNIVNQILDESGASVKHRQTINDRCGEFVLRLLEDSQKMTARQCLEIARGSVRHNPVPDAEWAAGWIEREISEQFGLEEKQ